MIAELLKNKTLELRKARSPMATFAVTVLAKANDLAKAETTGGNDPILTDAHAEKSIRSFLKKAEENLTLVKDNTADSYIKSLNEISLLKTWLPAQASEDEIREEAVRIKNASAKPNIGEIMKGLNEKFGSSLDRKIASDIAKSII